MLRPDLVSSCSHEQAAPGLDYDFDFGPPVLTVQPTPPPPQISSRKPAPRRSPKQAFLGPQQPHRAFPAYRLTAASWRPVHKEMLTADTAYTLIERAAVLMNPANRVAPAVAATAAAEGALPTPPAAKAFAEGAIDTGRAVVVLVEMNCQQGMRTLKHDKLKYDRYFEALREAIGDTIISPDGARMIKVSV